MPDAKSFYARAFGFSAPSVELGAVVLDGAPQPELRARLPFSTLNRHGLVAGATGTGKTKTLQAMAEQLSAAGVPVFAADIKGDLAGLSTPGAASPAVLERARSLGLEFSPQASPVEFFSLGGGRGIPLRASVASFGPLLLAKALGLNATQTSSLALIFKYCDDRGLLLLDLPDLRTALLYLAENAKSELAEYGSLPGASAQIILRKLSEIEQQGADRFFGEPELRVADLLRTGSDGRAHISLLELDDVQDKPLLFSTFLMWLLAEIYENLPEVGDVERPKLVFFFDEAHLLFSDASKEFMAQVEKVIRLVRSKGVGVFFVTQSPADIPETVLGQLGNRVQHALRAFTPKDRKSIRLVAQTFPESPYVDVEEALTTTGIGEALFTALDPVGVPTPTSVVRVVPPRSLMGAIGPDETLRRAQASPLWPQYGQAVNRESAYEMLSARAGRAETEARSPRSLPGYEPSEPRGYRPRRGRPPMPLAEKLGRAVVAEGTRQILRGLFSLLRKK